MSVETLSDLVFHLRGVAAGRPDLLSLRLPGRRETLSTTDLLRNVHSLALALEGGGLVPGGRVAIFSENRPEWHVVDLACQLLGAQTVPLDPALPTAEIAFRLRNSGCRWVFYSDGARRDQLLDLRSGLTVPPTLVAFDGDAAATPGGSLTRLLGAASERRAKVPIERFRGRVAAADLASIAYRVAPDGERQAVMLSHGELAGRAVALATRLRAASGDAALSLVSLSEPAQRTFDHACFVRGVAIVYLATASDPAAALRELRPAALCAAPRLYERLHGEILATAPGDREATRRLFRWAMEPSRPRGAGAPGGLVRLFLAARRWLAGRLVHPRIRRRLGGRLRLAVVAGEPLPSPVSGLFATLGVPLHETAGGDGLSAPPPSPR